MLHYSNYRGNLRVINLCKRFHELVGDFMIIAAKAYNELCNRIHLVKQKRGDIIEK